MTETAKGKNLCRGCGRPFPPGTAPEAKAYCAQCLIERAERFIPEPAEEPRRSAWRQGWAWKGLLAAVLVLCAVLLVHQYPRFLAAIETQRPLRMGSYATDSATDACLRNLWRIAHDLQQGKATPGEGLLCPASGKPYRIVPGPNREIHCPTPEVHGFREMTASERNPVPELKR